MTRGEAESGVERVAGITKPLNVYRCKADYKRVKSIKIMMYFSSRNVVRSEAERFPVFLLQE